jgi:hypothetical protein
MNTTEIKNTIRMMAQAALQQSHEATRLTARYNRQFAAFNRGLRSGYIHSARILKKEWQAAQSKAARQAK